MRRSSSAHGWPSLYDITDDWLLAPLTQQELARLRHLEALALSHADEVVVCSSALAESRGKVRRVSLVPNGVDVEHFRHPQPRPKDLPPGPTAVYVGSLHDARLDVELVGELADALPQLNVVLVGPDTLGDESHRLLGRRPNVHLLGARPYENVPAYLQHADVLDRPAPDLAVHRVPRSDQGVRMPGCRDSDRRDRQSRGFATTQLPFVWRSAESSWPESRKAFEPF